MCIYIYIYTGASPQPSEAVERRRRRFFPPYIHNNGSSLPECAVHSVPVAVVSSLDVKEV